MDMKNVKTVGDISEEILKELNSLEAGDLLKWAFETFKDKAAIGTSFQLTGSVITDLSVKAVGAKNVRVFTVDTLRLHDETYEVMDEFEKFYGVTIEKFTPDEGKLKDMIDRFGEYLFFTDKAKQEYCCEVRKVLPNNEAVKTLDVWISGLRGDQSDYRKSVKKVEIVLEPDTDRKILKINPLNDWSRDKVKDHIKENNLPYNKLFDQNYDSIGCIICTTPQVEGEKPRAGRWRWFNAMGDDNKECGIHLNKKGDNK